MIYIIQHEHTQYQIHSDDDIDIAQEWESITQGPMYYLDSKTFPYRKLLGTRGFFILDNSHLTGFQEKFDENRNYHELLRIFLIHLREKFDVMDLIFQLEPTVA